jgi:uncharacterized protein YcbK (DUF882 family)
MQQEMIDMLEDFDTFLGHSLEITSGFRCHRKQNRIYKRRYKKTWETEIPYLSFHCMGLAIDGYSREIPLPELFKKAKEFGEWQGLGYYPKRSGGFIHFDIGYRRAVWQK